MSMIHVPKQLPEPIVDSKGEPVVCTCPICGAMNIGAPPHGEGEPCPIALRKATEEERAAVATQFMMNDLKAMMRKMGVIPEEDE